MRYKHFITASLLSITTAFFFLVSSCKKEYSAGVPGYQTLLSDSVWHYVRYDEDRNIDGSIDYTEVAPLCKSEASYTFQSNNLVVYTPAPVPCGPGDVANTCTYTFQNNGAAISWCGFNANIKMLNDTVMNLSFDFTDTTNGASIPVRGYLIYKH